MIFSLLNSVKSWDFISVSSHRSWALLTLGFSTRDYNLHSLQIGAAILAAAWVMPEDIIRCIGHWHADAFEIYIYKTFMFLQWGAPPQLIWPYFLLFYRGILIVMQHDTCLRVLQKVIRIPAPSPSRSYEVKNVCSVVGVKNIVCSKFLVILRWVWLGIFSWSLPFQIYGVSLLGRLQNHIGWVLTYKLVILPENGEFVNDGIPSYLSLVRCTSPDVHWLCFMALPVFVYCVWFEGWYFGVSHFWWVFYYLFCLLKFQHSFRIGS